MSEKLIRSAIAQLSRDQKIGIIAVDEHSKIIANVKLESLLGYQDGSLEGEFLSVILPSSVRDRHNDFVSGFMESGSGMKRQMGRGLVILAPTLTGGQVEVTIHLTRLELAGQVVALALIEDAGDSSSPEMIVELQGQIKKDLLQNVRTSVRRGRAKVAAAVGAGGISLAGLAPHIPDAIKFAQAVVNPIISSRKDDRANQKEEKREPDEEKRDRVAMQKNLDKLLEKVRQRHPEIQGVAYYEPGSFAFTPAATSPEFTKFPGEIVLSPTERKTLLESDCFHRRLGSERVIVVCRSFKDKTPIVAEVAFSEVTDDRAIAELAKTLATDLFNAEQTLK